MKAIGRFGAITLLLPLLMGADVYRWVDENGVVNYTQTKPRGVDAVQLQTSGRAVRSAPTPPAAAETEQPAGISTEQRRLLREMQNDERDRRQHVAKVKQENCATARETLETLTIRGRVRIRDDNGEVRVVPEEERQKRIAEAQQAVLEHCGS